MKKIDCVIISFTLIIFLYVGLFEATDNVLGDQEHMPFNIRLASIMKTELSISWVTPENATGHVIYGTDSGNLNMTAWDDRGSLISSDTHHVRIGDKNDTEYSYGVITGEEYLIPNTTYYFKLVSNGIVYGHPPGDDIGVPMIDGDPWTVNTSSTPSYSNSHFVFGNVYNKDDETEVEYALVYCTITNRSTGITSSPLSLVTDTDGAFGFNISEVRNENGSMFWWAPYDGLNIFAHAGKRGSGVNGVYEINDTFIRRYNPTWPLQGPVEIYLEPNQPPTLDIISPPAQGDVANASYKIEWNFFDFDDDAILNLYYDMDTSEGGEVTIASNISEESTIREFTIDTTVFPADAVFYVKAEIADGFNPILEVYSSGITIDRTPPSAILDLSAQPGVNDGEVNLSWTASGDDGNIGTAESYVIRFSNSSISESNWEMATGIECDLSPKEPGSSESFTVTNLTTGQLYYFAIKTHDGASLSQISNVASSIPQEDLGPPGWISDLRAETGSETGEVNLLWTATGDDGNVGRASMYTIKYNTSLISDSNWNASIEVENPLIPQTSGNPETFTVTNLTPDIRYFFAIKAFDEGLNPSDLSNVANAVAMLDIVSPGAITDLEAKTGIKNGEVMLFWTAPGDDGDEGRAIKYILKYSYDRITDETWDEAVALENFTEPEVAGNSQNFTVEGLTPGLEYFFAIKSLDERPNLSPVSNSPSAKAYSDSTFLVIDSPKDNEIYLTTETIIFDASNTTDADDNLTFHWTSNIDGGFGDVSWVATNLSKGQHIVTVFVVDEKGNLVRGSMNITVISPTPIDDNQTQDLEDNLPISYACMFSLVLLALVVALIFFDVRLYLLNRKIDSSNEKMKQT